VAHYLITGSRGFIGKNLILHLQKIKEIKLITLSHRDFKVEVLEGLMSEVDFVVHLAGVNRSLHLEDFSRINVDLTRYICESILLTGRSIPLIFTSSTQAAQDNPYGKSKYEAEKYLERYSIETGNPVKIYRLPGVFGKWCKPNYNSVVATFCNNIANGLPISISDSSVILNLVYIDDVVEDFMRCIDKIEPLISCGVVTPSYSINLDDLKNTIESFREGRKGIAIPSIGNGFIRALYATYLSYLPVSKFTHELPKFVDKRGLFAEILKTPDCGQLSFFTIKPDQTRGSHYHHTKNEKFIVVKGDVRLKYRNIITNEIYEINASNNNLSVIDSIPGWAHNIKNIGEEEAIVIVWANEVFDRSKPDTIECEV